MTAPYVLVGLVSAAVGFYVTTRIRLRRALDAEQYRHETAQRMAAAPWRRHLSVVIDADGSYAYIGPRPEQKKGGGSDARKRVEAQLGLVNRRSLAGGKGSPSGPPCKYCGEPDGYHTGQCPVISKTSTRS